MRDPSYTVVLRDKSTGKAVSLVSWKRTRLQAVREAVQVMRTITKRRVAQPDWEVLSCEPYTPKP